MRISMLGSRKQKAPGLRSPQDTKPISVGIIVTIDIVIRLKWVRIPGMR